MMQRAVLNIGCASLVSFHGSSVTSGTVLDLCSYQSATRVSVVTDNRLGEFPWHPQYSSNLIPPSLRRLHLCFFVAQVTAPRLSEHPTANHGTRIILSYKCPQSRQLVATHEIYRHHLHLNTPLLGVSRQFPRSTANAIVIA